MKKKTIKPDSNIVDTSGKDRKGRVRKPSLDTGFFVSDDCYEINGKSYVRVTRVLDIVAKPEFYRWYAKHGYEWCVDYRDDRAVFGTRMHKEFHNFLDDKPVWLDSKEMKEVYSHFKSWLSLHDVKPVCLECNVYNDELSTAGTIDFVGDFDGKTIVLDWKTSKKVYDTYPVQVAIYMFMYESMYDIVLDGAGVVCFTKSGVVESWFSREECLELVKVFRAARELYRWKYGK